MLETYYQPQLPINTGVIIEKDSPVKLLESIVNSLDLSKLEDTRRRSGRKLKISRKQLLTILIYSYMECIYSSRSIADKLTRDTHYMYLAREQVVSHNTINKFRQSLVDEVFLDIFRQFVLKLYELNEVSFQNIFIDGTKLEANANRYSFVWKKAINKHEEKLQGKVKVLINKINNDSNLSIFYHFNEQDKVTVEIMSDLLRVLNRYSCQNNIEFKSGKGKKKTQIQRYIEELEDYLVRQSNYDYSNDIFEDRNSYSKTDESATFMRMKDDHMKNGQLKAGYNVQVGVEGEYVIGVEIFSDCNDINTLIPFLERFNEFYGIRFNNVISDSGYASEKNYSYLDKIKTTFYIPYQSYYQEQTKKFKKMIGKRQNMIYDEKENVYICANNRKLEYVGETVNKRDPDYHITNKNYKCRDCSGCPFIKECMPYSKKEDASKNISFSPSFEKYKKQALKNIKTEEGINLRINRSIQAEGFFGILKQDYNFRRFMLRGSENVHLEMLLLCFAFNMRKLHKNMKNNNLGKVTFHIPKKEKVQ